MSRIAGSEAAKRLLLTHDSLLAMGQASADELVENAGISHKQAEAVKGALQLADIVWEERQPDPLTISSPLDLVGIWRTKFHGLQVEQFRVALLDIQNHLIKDIQIPPGSATGLGITPHEVLRPAIQFRVAAIAVAHNHPSGDPTPSEPDIGFTHDLHAACKALRLPLHDHIIFGVPTVGQPKGYASFRELDLLD